MHFILCIILLIVGLIQLFDPKSWYEWKESWKHTSHTEPSDDYIKRVRISGVTAIAFVLLAIVLSFLV